MTLGPGRYTWQCAEPSGEIVTSQAEPVTGPRVVATPSYMPARPDDLSAAVYQYRDEVTAGISTLVGAKNQLQRDVDAQDLPVAKAQWLVAHLAYEQLGAAYDTFGPFDQEIDGRADGLSAGVNDKRFTGFLRLEYGLWHGQSWNKLRAVTSQLDGFVRGLEAAFPHQLMVITDLPLCAHEILENALQFELTGDTDEGSHTNLATVQANVVGTESVLGALQPLLATRNPSLLNTVDQDLSRLASLVGTFDRHGAWVPVQSLTTSEHEQLDAAMDSLLEQLSITPGSLRLFAVGAD